MLLINIIIYLLFNLYNVSIQVSLIKNTNETITLEKLFLNDQSNNRIRYKLATKFSIKANNVGDKCVSHYDCIHFNAGCAFDQQTREGRCLFLCDDDETKTNNYCNDREICKEVADSFTNKNLYLPLGMCFPVECKVNEHCSGNEICLDNQCILKEINSFCGSNDDCNDKDTVCDVDAKSCSQVQCFNDDECFKFGGICNRHINVCVQIPITCNINEDCISTAYVCDTLIQTCVLEDVFSNYHCREHKHCQETNSITSICDKSRNVCIVPPTCKNDFDCRSTTQYCDKSTLTCNPKEPVSMALFRPPKFNNGKPKGYETEIIDKEHVCFSDVDCAMKNHYCNKSTNKCREYSNSEFVEITNTISEMLTTSSSCIDVAGNCKRHLHNCRHQKYKGMMEYACAKTCGFCKENTRYRKLPRKGYEKEVKSRYIPKKSDSVCQDNTRFRHHIINCENRKYLCKQKVYYEFMRFHCSKTCGFCSDTQ
uniref:ShKT domain-containing protein n=1 Tax=Parastrongyloides trichosuri TaxID=131310 RepID=A0A0N4Z4P3_PARTI